MKRWQRMTIEITIMMAGCTIAVSADHAFGTCLPAALFGYAWGVTAIPRLRWIDTGTWQFG